MNRRLLIVKRRFNLFYGDLFYRHSINGGNVIKVETVFQKFEASEVLGMKAVSATFGRSTKLVLLCLLSFRNNSESLCFLINETGN